MTDKQQKLFILPYYATTSDHKNTTTPASTVATVAVNVSGTVAFALHLFLRQISSTNSTAISPSRAPATPLKPLPLPLLPPPVVVDPRGVPAGGGDGGGGGAGFYSPVRAGQGHFSAGTAATSVALDQLSEEITGLMITLLNSTREHSANLKQLETHPRYFAGRRSSPGPTTARGLHTHLRPASAASTVSATSFTFTSPVTAAAVMEQEVIEPQIGRAHV